MAASPTQPSVPAPGKAALWTGRILSALPVIAMLLSGTMKFLHPPQVVQGFTSLGYPESLILKIAILEVSCAILYAIPQTSVLGAILVTGYLGGAVATHVRVLDPSFVGGLILGIIAWLGLYLREPRLRALTPIRR